MNFVNGVARVARGDFPAFFRRSRVGTNQGPVAGPKSARQPKEMAGKEILLGIRPEDIELGAIYG